MRAGVEEPWQVVLRRRPDALNAPRQQLPFAGRRSLMVRRRKPALAADVNVAAHLRRQTRATYGGHRLGCELRHPRGALLNDLSQSANLPVRLSSQLSHAFMIACCSSSENKCHASLSTRSITFHTSFTRRQCWPTSGGGSGGLGIRASRRSRRCLREGMGRYLKVSPMVAEGKKWRQMR
jgi:hypothetical protein